MTSCFIEMQIVLIFLVSAYLGCPRKEAVKWVSPYVIGQTIIFLPCDFYLSSIFSSPNLSGRRLDVYDTSTQVWP